MIRAEHLVKRFSAVTAVDDVSFEIPRGRIAGFLGPNGAGKTTAMRLLCGVLAPDSGCAVIDGHDVSRMPRTAHARLGWLPEGGAAHDEMRVLEYLRFRGRMHGRAACMAVEEQIDRCGLGEVRRRLVGQLSRGFRQRVALAAALVNDPVALVLDEPGTGLDPVQQQTFRRLLRELGADRAILLSTHQLGEAAAVCDDLLIIGRGRILARGTTETLRQAHHGPSELIVEARGVDLHGCLLGIEGVHEVEVLPAQTPWQRVRCRMVDRVDRRESIADTLRQCGATVRELAPVGGSLEHAVQRILEGNAP